MDYKEFIDKVEQLELNQKLLEESLKDIIKNHNELTDKVAKLIGNVNKTDST